MSDDELAQAVGDTLKNTQKVCGSLKSGGMLKIETRWEEYNPNVVKEPLKDGRERKKIARSYYYIDYQHLINAVKYRIYKIGKSMEESVSQTITGMSYKCTNCAHTYSALDMLSLVSSRLIPSNRLRTTCHSVNCVILYCSLTKQLHLQSQVKSIPNS